MKRYIQIGIVVVAIITVGTLSGFLINTNSKLGQVRNDLNSQQQTATAASSLADATQERQFGLSTEAISTLSAKNRELESYRSTLVAMNLGVIGKNKDLVEWLGDVGGSNLTATWEVIWNNSRAAIHRIRGQYMWVFIVTFEDNNLGTHDSIYFADRQCFLFVQS